MVIGGAVPFGREFEANFVALAVLSDDEDLTLVTLFATVDETVGKGVVDREEEVEEVERKEDEDEDED